MPKSKVYLMNPIRFQNVAAFVLAGGASERMGQDKALLELAGVPMVIRAVRLAQPYVASVAIVAPHDRYAQMDLRILPDCWPGAGPLGGIATALSATISDWNLILGCDLPHLMPEWVAWFISRALKSPAQAVIPESRRGLEPLAAMYHKSCGETLTAAVERGVRRVTEGLSELMFERVSMAEWRELDPTGKLFENMNTPEDYAEARRRIEGTVSP
jgi:molybdopterin-guanine dinucleotide biosynthesis protein A